VGGWDHELGEAWVVGTLRAWVRGKWPWKEEAGRLEGEESCPPLTGPITPLAASAAKTVGLSGAEKIWDQSGSEKDRGCSGVTWREEG
jgi:hypothetical protein